MQHFRKKTYFYNAGSVVAYTGAVVAEVDQLLWKLDQLLRTSDKLLRMLELCMPELWMSAKYDCYLSH